MKYLLLFLIVLQFSHSFVSLIPKTANTILNQYCSDRKIYGSYLLGLRKTRKLLRQNYSKSELDTVINFTEKFVNNYTKINNTETQITKITMKNLVLDVSNIQQIEIKIKKDKMIIDLDNKPKIKNFLQNANNIEIFVSVMTLFGKALNLNP